MQAARSAISRAFFFFFFFFNPATPKYTHNMLDLKKVEQGKLALGTNFAPHLEGLDVYGEIGSRWLTSSRVTDSHS